MQLFKYMVTILLLSTALFSSEIIDKKIIDFEKKRIADNPSLKLQDIVIEKKLKLQVSGWYGYLLKITLYTPSRGMVTIDDTLFSNGEAITQQLINLNNGLSFQNALYPQMNIAYYKEENLIEGNKEAKNKVVIFSDPLCPYCQRVLPSMIKKVRATSKEVALYYYHFPLEALHPAAVTLSKAMIVAKEKGIKNVEIKIYSQKLNQYFSANEKDDLKILKGVNKIFNTDITIKDINNPKVQKQLQSDMKMGEEVRVEGTPTIFVNGVKDKSRKGFEKLIKEEMALKSLMQDKNKKYENKSLDD